jgi:hypothetical protein
VAAAWRLASCGPTIGRLNSANLYRYANRGRGRGDALAKDHRCRRLRCDLVALTRLRMCVRSRCGSVWRSRALSARVVAAGAAKGVSFDLLFKLGAGIRATIAVNGNTPKSAPARHVGVHRRRTGPSFFPKASRYSPCRRESDYTIVLRLGGVFCDVVTKSRRPPVMLSSPEEFSLCFNTCSALPSPHA